MVQIQVKIIVGLLLFLFLFGPMSDFLKNLITDMLRQMKDILQFL